MIEELYQERCRMTTDINEHLPLLKELASEVDHVTEFGVREGNSTIALACGRPSRMVSYDIKKPSQELLERLGMWLHGFQFIQADTLEVEIEPTDLLFIDTYHTYNQLARELTLHGYKARKYIVMHDTETFGVRGEDALPGLQKAINEFRVSNSEWWMEHYKHNNGLTVLSK